MNQDKLRSVAEYYRYMYNTNQCTRQEAKDYILPYIKYINQKSIVLAKKYNQKPKQITFAQYIR